MSNKNEFVGKVINHSKYGYGVVWRADKFDRISVKFANGKEIGAFDSNEMDFMDKDSIKKNDVITKLGDSGLSDFIDMNEYYDLINDYISSKELMFNVFNDMIEDIYHLYIIGESMSKIKSVFRLRLSESCLNEDSKINELNILRNLKSSFQVVKYVSSKLVEIKGMKIINKIGLGALESTLSKIIKKLNMDGKLV